MATPYKNGRKAYKDHWDIDDNPYEVDSRDWWEWEDGWKYEQRRRKAIVEDDDT